MFPAVSAEVLLLFLLQVVDSLDVSPHGTRVGLVQYSSRVRTEFPLSMYHTAEEIKAAVMKVSLEKCSSQELRNCAGVLDVSRIRCWSCSSLALGAASAEADWLFCHLLRWSTWRRAP